MAFQPERFGKYYLVDKIAVGGMAEIFKAKQFGEGGFEKVLVIKRILSHLSEDQDFIQMFFDEAKISSTLAHSNIIHTYDFGKIKNNYFLAMEYCDGKDLKTVMKKCQEIGRSLPVEYPVYIIHEVLKGLDYAHRKQGADGRELNILHRDISPSNIMISYDEGKVKLADFGIAKAENASYKTKAGVLKGKFEYMSPEQASGLNTDRRSDIFAVGICFYEILTRRRLFKTDSDLKTLELIRNPLIPPPSNLNPQVREELDAIVMKALARRPEDRYQDAWQMQNDLREFMRASTPPASPDMIALSLANFMRDIFSREIRQEGERMEQGTRYVKEMLGVRNAPGEPDQDESWDVPSDNSRVTSMSQVMAMNNTSVRLMIEEKKKASTNRNIILGGVAVAVLGGVGLFAALGGKDKDDSPAVEASPAAPLDPTRVKPAGGSSAANSGGEQQFTTLNVNSDPVGAKILLDGVLIGTTPLTYRELLVGKQVELKVEATGYQPYLQSLKPSLGVNLDILDIKLQRAAGSPPKDGSSRDKERPTPRPTSSSGESSAPAQVASSGRLEFFSVPSGGRVSVNGRYLCTAPCAMENGRADASYEVEVTMDGFGPYRTRVRYPSAGSSQVNAALQAVEMGSLTLTIKDGLSAELYIDGRQKGGLNSFWEKMPLPAGRHSIRLRNPTAGLERTVTVEVTPGQETRLLGVELKE